MIVERLKAENYDELMDFINMVFSQDLIRIHFQEDIPIAFGRSDERMQYQYVVRDESERIRAAIGVIPYTLIVGNETFQIRGITNVATHYQHCGKGYMQALFKRALEDMRREGVSLSLLIGHRERYRFLGYESAGLDIIAQYESYNISNRLKLGEQHDFCFKPVTSRDTEEMSRLLELHNKYPMHYLRPMQTAMEAMASWTSTPYAVYNAQNMYCGYLICSQHWGTASVSEVFLCHSCDFSRVIYSFMTWKNLKQLTVALSPFDNVILNEAYETAEHITTQEMCLLNLLKPEQFLTACLNLKQGYCELPKGELVLDCIFGKLLFKNDGMFTVNKTERPADAEIPGHQIYPLLFGPVSPAIPQFSQIPTRYTPWFPVPFYIPKTERY